MDTQKIKRMELKHNFKEIHQVTREETKRRQEQGEKKKATKMNKNNQKTINKIAITTYLLIITLNLNGQNALIKRHREMKQILSN